MYYNIHWTVYCIVHCTYVSYMYNMYNIYIYIRIHKRIIILRTVAVNTHWRYSDWNVVMLNLLLFLIYMGTLFVVTKGQGYTIMSL